ncbi:cyclic pyranopterin phosphate synthase [Anaerobranca californiensis DSM 14826]|uniref:GTP 3',8-cyclase n=1 Tax=Anaerobranca californiensis DSM 14826 TaxID=1120989 RepID=A0A1M6M6U9_9FIRM|nr:GTP 3',8-cyclase MoaA [Anaerobranca californiensis]SHJ79226.1 cyclic pyranopterin phosphate synthase [Anaerobranca californiensis DSM 14826]
MLKDKFGRKINYLRISLIDRCNLRCKYCMPPNGVDLYGHDKILTYEELLLIIKAAAELGINSIRLTGGEPLIRRGLIPFIKTVSNIDGIDDIAITTNGVLLEEMADDLKKAGVNRLNISLDTLNKDKFKEITGRDQFEKVFKGINKSIEVGFEPVKINVVMLKNFNEGEILDFVKLTKDKPLHVRFIEMMPLGESKNNWTAGYMPWNDALELVKREFEVRESSGPKGSGPAKYYTIPGFLGTFGFITPVGEHFCHQCNRIRLTSDGFLKTCLFGNNEVNLKKLSKTGDINKIKEAIIKSINEKPEKHQITNHNVSRFMSQIGG